MKNTLNYIGTSAQRITAILILIAMVVGFIVHGANLHSKVIWVESEVKTNTKNINNYRETVEDIRNQLSSIMGYMKAKSEKE